MHAGAANMNNMYAQHARSRDSAAAIDMQCMRDIVVTGIDQGTIHGYVSD